MAGFMSSVLGPVQTLQAAILARAEKAAEQKNASSKENIAKKLTFLFFYCIFLLGKQQSLPYI